MRSPDRDLCRNPRCQDWLPKYGPGGYAQVWDRAPLLPFCPSCRLAGQWGAVIAGALWAIVELLRRWL